MRDDPLREEARRPVDARVQVAADLGRQRGLERAIC